MKYARIEGATKLTTFIKPMLAQLSDAPAFDNPEWVFEIKWDGYRAVSEIKKNAIKFYSRNGLTFEKAYPKIFNELKSIKHECILDGEVVVFDKNNKPNFQKLQNYDSFKDLPIFYYIFDCLSYNGKDISGLPLLQRKNILKKILPPSDMLKYCDHVEEKGKEFFAGILHANFEGMIAKRATSLYLKGKRTTDWLKIKNINTDEAIIVGYTDPKGSRSYFGSLLLAANKNGKLTYISNVGTGFTQQSLKELYGKLKSISRKDSPLDVPIKQTADMHWVDPVLVCNIRFTEITDDGSIRHPVFMGLRVDKPAQEVTLEKPLSQKKGDSKNSTVIKVDNHQLTVNNLEKIYFPKQGITKAALLQYYESIASYILPHLKDKPQTLFRNPGGIEDTGFYHKNAGDIAPDFVVKAKVPSETSREDRHLILCNNKASLLFLNSLGCIEINPWLSRLKKIDYPDYMVIDLDPSEDNTFEEVIDAALVVKSILDKAQAKAYCKTSGSSGLHIYVPLKAQYDYEQTRAFGNIVAILTTQQLPNTTTLVRSLDKRKKHKIYVDYLQNKRGSTLASVYSVRPVENANVSMPLHWKEVKHGLHPADFTIHNALKRIKKEGDIFKGVLTEKTNLLKCLKNLGV